MGGTENTKLINKKKAEPLMCYLVYIGTKSLTVPAKAVIITLQVYNAQATRYDLQVQALPAAVDLLCVTVETDSSILAQALSS